MTWGIFPSVPPAEWPRLASSFLQLTLAVWLLYLAPRSRPTRAFAAYLAVAGVNTFLISMHFSARAQGDLDLELGWRLANHTMLLALNPALLYFGLAYPRARTWIGRSRAGAWTVAGVAVAVMLLHVAQPSLLYGLRMEDGAVGLVSSGPLLLFASIPVQSFLLLLWAREFATDGRGRQGAALLFVATAFGAFATFNIVRNVSLQAGRLVGGDPAVFGTFVSGWAPWTTTASNIVASTLIVLAAKTFLRAQAPEARQRARVAVVILGSSALAALMPLALQAAGQPALSEILRDILYGLFRLALVLLVTYALIRHRLFGIDIRIKWTIKQSTLAGIFIGLFFVVSESAAAFFSEQVGTYMGIVAAGGLVFAIAPLQHFAQRVADRAMPGVKSVGEMDDDERRRVYAEAAAEAWADGSLTRQERALLVRLQTALGIAADEAQRLEQEVADR